jgi:hypothetical protein
MLGALIQALKGVHRLILIGDFRQLPPIGSGRPFVDIVRHLVPEGIVEKFPRVAPGYAELTIHRRQGRSGEEREDLQLAEWFSGSPIAPGEDDVFDKVVAAGQSKHVRFVQWDSAEEMREKLLDMLVAELGLAATKCRWHCRATRSCSSCRMTWCESSTAIWRLRAYRKPTRTAERWTFTAFGTPSPQCSASLACCRERHRSSCGTATSA